MKIENLIKESKEKLKQVDKKKKKTQRVLLSQALEQEESIEKSQAVNESRTVDLQMHGQDTANPNKGFDPNFENMKELSPLPKNAAKTQDHTLYQD